MGLLHHRHHLPTSVWWKEPRRSFIQASSPPELLALLLSWAPQHDKMYYLYPRELSALILESSSRGRLIWASVQRQNVRRIRLIHIIINYKHETVNDLSRRRSLRRFWAPLEEQNEDARRCYTSNNKRKHVMRGRIIFSISWNTKSTSEF